MRKYAVILAMLLCGGLAFSQTSQTRYVAVQNAVLKSSTGFFAGDLRTLSFGDAVTLISENGRWSQVRIGDQTGWVASSILSTRRIVPSNSSSVSASEVALAGKGFSLDLEIEYKNSGLDYSLVDQMEQTVVPSDDLLRFINEGRLFTGE